MHRETARRFDMPKRLLALSLAALACTGEITAPEVEPAHGGGGPVHVSDAAPDASTSGGVGGAAGRDESSAGASNAGAGGTARVDLLDAGSVGGRPPSGGSTQDAPVCDAVTKVLLVSCGGGSCHSNPSAGIGDWAVGRAEAESFVDVPSVRNTACGFIIDSSDTSQSLLLRKITGDFTAPMCGGAMPVSGADLTDEQIDCMRSWLTQFQR
jgi:hypothetical protein